MSESDNEPKIHTAQETAERALVLYALCLVAHGELSNSSALAWLKAENLWQAIAPSEKRFFEKVDVTKQDIINATWRAEALWPLLWAIGQVDALTNPTATVNPSLMVEILPRPPAPTVSFVQNARLRSEDEIYAACTDILDIHWSIRDAQMNKREIPNDYHPGVVRERHFALNWLTYYDDEWDEITTDT